MRDIGKNIKDLREKKGLTQDELAETLFVTRQTVSNYENGRSRPDIDMLMNISRVLETDVNHLLYGIPEQAGRRKEVHRLIIACVALAVLFLLSALSVFYFDTLTEHRYIIPPRHFLGALLSPAFFLILGWVLAQGACLLFDIRPKARPWFVWVRRGLLGLLLICALYLLPYCIWGFFCWVRALTQGNINSTFPMGPVHQAIHLFLLRLNLQCTGVYALLGGLLCLLGFPNTNPTDNNKKPTA